MIQVDRMKGEVEFNHVTLNYTEHDEAALEDISFKAASGKVIGLIGGTGSVKRVSPS